LQGKENSRKDLTIRICVNLQRIELSMKSRIGSCKEMNLQGTELASNTGGIFKEWTLQGMHKQSLSM